ncbi:hypothetical protein GR217_34170 [Rhizobium leguminosarum]|uniref:Uncharacterized protein n=1 Tax=Rhizobium ruizarguesonis TaxID=2081791 RepID=A0AAE4YX78_9HYPH|nr:hypothetical protein [Rhizobium ruizarguesonis]NEI52666.1 hypothetical protein [Rhizobium ruizarguesonis]
MRTVKDNSAALDAFVAKKMQIDNMLNLLLALSDRHFEVAPQDVTWGDVGDLEHYAAQLKEITDRAFRQGEYAPEAR